jgi:protein O-GlcNAc transferase
MDLAAYYQQGLAAHRSEDYATAERCYLAILSSQPNHVPTLHLLGILHTQLKQFDQAIQRLHLASQLAPHEADIHAKLGIAYHDAGNIEAAATAYERALVLRPDDAATLYHLGSLYQSLNDFEKALTCYHQALSIDPSFYLAWNNIGNTFAAQQRWSKAVEAYSRCLAIQPSYAAGHFNLGNALKSSSDFSGAIDAYQKAISLNPNFVDAHFNAAVLYERLQLIELAKLSYQRVVELSPTDSGATFAWLHQKQYLCEWEGIEELTQAAFELAKDSRLNCREDFVPPFYALSSVNPSSLESQKEIASWWCRTLVKPTTVKERPEPFKGRSNEQSPGAMNVINSTVKSKLRLGYLSNDFHGHATAWLMAEVFENHDRENFETVAYSYGPDDHSPVRERLVRAFDRFVDVADESEATTAERIAQDRIDILIDLKGHTRQSRLSILAFRPAPVQIHYLGYPGTLGSGFVDFLIVDEYIASSSVQAYYAERLLPVPGCYQANERKAIVSEKPFSRHDFQLPENAFVFCSFNSAYKFTPLMFATWMDILRQEPSSVLWLLEPGATAISNLRRSAANYSVDPARLIFAKPLPRDEHLARLRLADLFLDTFPVNAHTTASDSLRMGIPLVTMSGDLFVSRVAGSLLQQLGLNELITESIESYQSLAVELASDSAKLEMLRSRLKVSVARSDIFDGKAMARKLEAAYRVAWKSKKTA